MAWTFRAAGSTSGTGSPGMPAGKAAGDLLLLKGACRLISETYSGPPSGWTTLYQTNRSVLIGRIASGDASDDLSAIDLWSGTSNNRMQVAAFYGGGYTNLATIVLASNSLTSGGNANMSFPALNLASHGFNEDNCLIIAAGKKNKTVTSDGATYDDPTWDDARIGFEGSNGTVAFYLWNYKIQTTRADIAQADLTQSITETLDYDSFIVALRAAAATVKKLKLLVHSDAQSDTSIAGAVFQAPGGSDITGAKIGEFTGKAFEATLEGGKAVLKVPVADFGGSALTTSDVPVAIVRNATDTTGMIAGTVIEE